MSRVTFDKLLNLSELGFPHLKNRRTCLTGCEDEES